MESKDGKTGFDYEGTYTEVIRTKLISYKLSDDRRVSVMFEQLANGIRVVQRFDADENTDGDIQRETWQAILDRFKLHTESL